MAKESKALKAEKKRISDSKVVKYWESAIQRAGKKMPIKSWELAEERLSAGEVKGGVDTRPVVNDLRNHYEGSRAYLDQREPSFKTVPSSAFANDPNILKRAECERKYLEYVWREQKCQIAQSQKLDSSLIRNVGFTMPYFDLKKWMPGIRYLPPGDVRLDPDCSGLEERISWDAYKEVVSLEILKANNPGLTKAEIETLKKKGASSLTEKEKEEADDDAKELYAVATVWHIFAKNDSATRLYDEEEEIKSLTDELKLNTALRYIQLAEGLQRPLQDKSEWPFKLDHNENMITRLQMNKEPENLYGYTDYDQMVRMDLMSDNTMTYIEADTYWAANKKYTGNENDGQSSETAINDFLNTNKKVFIPGLLGDDGKPTIQRIDAGNVNQSLVGSYDLMHNQSKEATGQNELQTESVADLKDVTAIGIRWQEQKLHQRVNLRLGGPRGYEESIYEDAVKMMEIAHQLVPRLSVVAVTKEVPETGVGEVVYREDETLELLPWEQAKEAIKNGGTLVKLGVDAIVGEELAKHWVTTEDVPIEDIRLATKIMIVPGSTRTITQEQRAADLENYYNTLLFPTIYEPMGRFDLAAKFAEHIGELKGVDSIEDYLPQSDEIKQFLEQQQQAQQAEGQQAQQEMAAKEQEAQLNQTASEADIQKEAIKADIELEKEIGKAELEEQKGQMQLRLMSQKKAPEK